MPARYTTKAPDAAARDAPAVTVVTYRSAWQAARGGGSRVWACFVAPVCWGAYERDGTAGGAEPSLTSQVLLLPARGGAPKSPSPGVGMR
jgi:hypothetical protein